MFLILGDTDTVPGGALVFSVLVADDSDVGAAVTGKSNGLISFNSSLGLQELGIGLPECRASACSADCRRNLKSSLIKFWDSLNSTDRI